MISSLPIWFPGAPEGPPGDFPENLQELNNDRVLVWKPRRIFFWPQRPPGALWEASWPQGAAKSPPDFGPPRLHFQALFPAPRGLPKRSAKPTKLTPRASPQQGKRRQNPQQENADRLVKRTQATTRTLATRRRTVKIVGVGGGTPRASYNEASIVPVSGYSFLYADLPLPLSKTK